MIDPQGNQLFLRKPERQDAWPELSGPSGSSYAGQTFVCGVPGQAYEARADEVQVKLREGAFMHAVKLCLCTVQVVVSAAAGVHAAAKANRCRLQVWHQLHRALQGVLRSQALCTGQAASGWQVHWHGVPALEEAPHGVQGLCGATGRSWHRARKAGARPAAA